MNSNLKKEMSKSDPRRGLCEQDVLHARKQYGSNLLTRQKRKSFLRQLVGNLNDPIIRILLGALAVKVVMLFRDPDWVETLGIAVAVLLATLISTLSEYSSARAFDRLSESDATQLCRVRRAGEVRQIAVGEIVVGDVVLLDAGELIPADGFLIHGSLRADQSAMTGESREIKKKISSSRCLAPDRENALFRGCTVTAGGGEMEIAAVGDATFLGGISKEIQMEQRESPLRLRLGRLAKQISRLGYAAALLVAFAYLFNVFVLDSGWRTEVMLLKLCDVGFLLEHLLHAFTLGLTVLVVAVPEGLPMMIAVVLSSNIRRMVRDNVLVRKPSGIEAAGSMNLLFTDKTGTLTEGNMAVSSFLTGDGGEIDQRALDGVRGELIALCLRAGSASSMGVSAGGERRAMGGNATDRALLEAVKDRSMSQGVEISCRLPFDSNRKYSAVTLCGSKRFTVVIGASERILPHTRAAIGADGRVVALSRTRMERRIRGITEEGDRVVAVAIAPEGVRATALASSVGMGGELTLVCAVRLSDPLRAEARDSVGKLQGAGIQVVMITGDSPETGRSIASRCGILCKDFDTVLTGEMLARMTDGEVERILPRLAVVARALPGDKSRLVRIAQERGLVVGMTGDGINDAPALRRADVGFAMGGGTQVAKDAGDIVILDDNLASVVRAVLYGRTIFKSIRKFITLQLTMNFYAVGVTMICPFLGIESPVTVVQMLWINLIMDTLGGLAFAGEAPLAESMTERPKRRDEAILNGYMVNQILFCGGFTTVLCILFLKHPFFTSMFRTSEENVCLLTAFFAFFIFASVFNCFNTRTDRLKLTAGLIRNPVFLMIMASILVIQLVFVYVGGAVLRTVPLRVEELIATMSLSLAVLPADLIRKCILRLLGRRDMHF